MVDLEAVKKAYADLQPIPGFAAKKVAELGSEALKNFEIGSIVAQVDALQRAGVPDDVLKQVEGMYKAMPLGFGETTAAGINKGLNNNKPSQGR